MNQGRHRFAVVAGGGTAGHVLPVLAVARAISEQGHEPSSIEVVGSQRGREDAVLATSGFPYTLVPGRGLLRSAAPADVCANAASLWALTKGTVHMLSLLRRWRPAVVVTVGGYASFPAGLAAALLRIPVVLVNTDAVPGLVHRVLERVAAAAAVAFPGTPLRRAVVTGTPVRQEMTKVDRLPAARRSARRELGIPEERDLVIAFGGSLGARRINQAVRQLAEEWKDRKDLALYHVVGRRDWEASLEDHGAWPAASPRCPEGLWYHVVPFEDRMPLLYQAADLAICRAGAMTVGELALTGVPAILVPLPGAPDDHQTANAKVLVRAGGARLLADSACSAQGLRSMAEGLLDDPKARVSMAAAARSLGHPDAAQRVAEVVIAHAR